MKTHLLKIQFSRYFLLVLISFALIGISNNASPLYAQSGLEVDYSDIDNEWKLLKVENGAQIFYKKAERHDPANGIFQEMILFKVVNTTNTKLEMQWKCENWYDGKCWNCDSDTKEHQKALVLEAGESKEGEVDRDTEYPQLRLFSKFLNYDDKPELTKFRFVNMEVNPA